MLCRGCCVCVSELHSETCDFGADLRQLPLAGIAPKRARGPKRFGGVDPGGLWGFLHLGLDVGVDLRGRGRQLGACHGSLPPRVLPPAESGKMWFPPLLLSEQAQLTQRHRCRRKTASPSHWCCTRAEGERLPPCRITGSSDTVRRASACLLVMECSSILDGNVRSLCVFMRRHIVTSTARPTQRTPQHVT